jgi:integrase
MLLDDVDPVAVESWLRQLAIADGSKVKIRNVMSSVFSHALRNKLMAGQTNPISLVRQSGKRKRVPEYLEASELKSFLGSLEQRERTLVFLDAGTGLRVSELLALKWEDLDFENKLLHVRRSIVQQVIGNCKTEASKKPVPLDTCLVEDLRRWRSMSFFNRPSDWVFASVRMAGRQPYWPDSLLRRVIRPAALKAGITKRIGWHTFRHSFSTLLRANGEDIKVVQELLRHANSRTTLDLYTQAPSSDKRKAQERVVRKFAPKRKAVGARKA